MSSAYVYCGHLTIQVSRPSSWPSSSRARFVTQLPPIPLPILMRMPILISMPMLIAMPTMAPLTMADLPAYEELPHLPRRLVAHPRALLRRLRLRLQPAGTFPSYHPCSSAPRSHLRSAFNPQVSRDYSTKISFIVVSLLVYSQSCAPHLPPPSTRRSTSAACPSTARSPPTSTARCASCS